MDENRAYMLETLIRDKSTPGKVVPLLLNKAGDNNENRECWAITWKSAMTTSSWKSLVDEAFEIYDFVETHGMNCKDYNDKHVKCVINCACLVDIPKTGESKIRLINVDEENLKTPYKVCYEKGILNFKLLKLPKFASPGCLKFE